MAFIPPNSAITSLLSLHPQFPSLHSSFPTPQSSPFQEPLDCTTPPVLDLCTRRPSQTPSQSLSPKPEGARLKLSPISQISQIPTMLASPPIISTAMDHFPITPPGSFNPLANTEVDSSSEEGSVGSVKSDMQDMSLYPSAGNMKSKVPRPFKAYPKDPFFLAIGASTADSMLGQESTEAYTEFRKRMLSQVRANNPLPGVTNAKMRRSNFPTNAPDFQEGKDASYWEKRKKNNEAAKRSRDARRAKEDEIAIRAAFLEQENLKLKYEIAALRNETTKLRCLLYN